MRSRFCFLFCLLALILGEIQVNSVFARAPSTAKIVFTSTRDGNSEIYIMNFVSPAPSVIVSHTDVLPVRNRHENVSDVSPPL